MGFETAALLLLLSAPEKPIVAVFDLEDRSGTLSTATRAHIAEVIAAELAKSRRFEIVPRADLKNRLKSERLDSYRECYDESCQIELGKELAANHVLQTQVVRIGRNCTLTMRLYDVRKATAVLADSHRVRCDEEAVLDSSIRAAAFVAGEREASKEPDFRASVLSELSTPEVPTQVDLGPVKVSYAEVDIDALEAFDLAIRADRDAKVPTKEKIERWQKVLDLAPEHRELALVRLEEWRRYQLQSAAIEEAKARQKADWEKLSRLLALSVVSDEDKRKWAEAFVESYGWDPTRNPYIRERALVGWVSAGSTDWTAAAPTRELEKRVAEAKANLRARPGDAALLRQKRAIDAELDCRRGKLCTFLGQCSFDAQVGGCFAASNDQCARSRVCSSELRCRASQGTCVAGGGPSPAPSGEPPVRAKQPESSADPARGSGRAPLRNQSAPID